MDQSQGELQPFLLECFKRPTTAQSMSSSETVRLYSRPVAGGVTPTCGPVLQKSFAEPDWSSGHACGITFEPVGRLSWRISFRHTWCVPGSATRNPLPVSITCR